MNHENYKRSLTRQVAQPVLGLAALLALCSYGVGQQTNTPAPGSPAAAKITLSLIVTDRSKHSLDDLSRESIQIFEDKVPQTVSLFVKDDRAVDYGLVIDTSGSLRKLLNFVVQGARLVVENNRDLDETFVERFVGANKIETVQEFTADKARLRLALDSLYVEGGLSAVNDGVYLALKHVAAHRPGPERRRALVLITDGEDRASYYSESQLFQLAREKDVQIFVIGIVVQLDPLRTSIRTSPRQKAETLLTRLAGETGGRVFFPKDLDELRKAAQEISHDLHSQYLIGYEPSGSASKENFRRVEVKIVDAPGREKLEIIARPGYFASPPDSSGKEKDKKNPASPMTQL